MLRALRFVTFAGLLLQAGWTQQSYPFFSPSPAPPLLVTATANSPFGQSSYCYWVVVVYPIGKSTPSSPSCVSNAIETSSVLISWSAAQGASSYDVLRTTTPILPNVTSSIAVATAVSGTTQTDSFGALSSYTISSAVPATANLYLDNTAFSTPQLRAVITGVGGTTAFNLGAGGGGGTPGGSSGQVQYNNAGSFGGFTVSGDATLNTGTGVLTIGNGAVTNAKLANFATTVNGQTCTLGSTCNANAGAAAHSVSLNEGAGAAFAGATIGTGGRLLIDQGGAADPSFNAVSGDATITNAGVLTVTQVNGAVVPASAKLTSTNAGRQVVAAAAETAPITVSATGGIACGTCATTTNGGALSGTSPVTISAAGVIACATCATTTNGGALTATAPVTISAAGVIACSTCLTSVPWNTIVNPNGNLSLTMAANTSLFTFNATTGAGVDLFELTDTTNNTGTGNLLRSSTASGSAAAPFRADANGVGWQVNSSGNLVNLSTASEAITLTSLATTSTDGIVLTNTTASTSGTKQQYSPRLRFSGTFWNGSASVVNEWWGEVEATANSTTSSFLVFRPRNGGTNVSNFIALCYGGNNAMKIVGLDGTTNQLGCIPGDSGYSGIGSASTVGGNVFGIWTNGSFNQNFNNNGQNMGSAKIISWSSATDPANNTTGDTGLCRNGAAGLLSVNDGSATCTNFRDLEFRSLVSGGSVPGISGCSAGSQVGGNTGGSYASGTTGTCTVVLTFAKTAANGWQCSANDITTPADTQSQSGTSTTTCTITGTTVSGDVITFGARAY